MGSQATSLSEKEHIKKGAAFAAPFLNFVQTETSTYCKPFTRFGLATSVP